jgi:hypothetical protein
MERLRVAMENGRHIATVAAAEAGALSMRRPKPVFDLVAGLTVRDHQRLAIERYDALAPVRLCRHSDSARCARLLAREFVEHVEMYGDRLKPGMGYWFRVQAEYQPHSPSTRTA